MSSERTCSGARPETPTTGRVCRTRGAGSDPSALERLQAKGVLDACILWWMIRSTRVRSVSGAEKRWLKVFGTLNEFQARLFAADKALDLGRGGISRLSALRGLSRTTIAKAVEELSGRGKLVSPGEGRVRRAGGGRKKVEGVDRGVPDLLKKILEETTAGDPMSLLRWTSKSTRTIAEELTRLGHPVTWVTVARCLDDLGYSLQANRKTNEGR